MSEVKNDLSLVTEEVESPEVVVHAEAVVSSPWCIIDLDPA